MGIDITALDTKPINLALQDAWFSSFFARYIKVIAVFWLENATAATFIVKGFQFFLLH